MGELSALQQSRLDFMQNNLRRIRAICEWSGNDLAELLGVSRQSINNLEINKSKMTPAMLLALGVMLEEFCKKVPEARTLLNACISEFPQSEDCNVAREKISIDRLCSAWLAEYPGQFAMTKERIYGAKGIPSMRIMEKIASNYKIFACPDILTANNGISRIEDLCILARESGNVVNIPANAFKELIPDLSEDAKIRIAQLQSNGSLVFRGDDDDPPLEKLIIEKFIQYKDKYNLCLITNDKGLANDILLLNNLKSVKAFTIIVIYIDENGHLGFWDENIASALASSHELGNTPDFENSFSVSSIDFSKPNKADDPMEGWQEI